MKKGEFEKLRHEELSKFKESMIFKIEKHRIPGQFIQEQIGKLDSELTQLHNSNRDLTEIFFEQYNLSLEDKNLRQIDLCEDYCINNMIDAARAIMFFPKIFFYYNAKTWLSSLLFISPDEEEADNASNEEELKHTNFTLARRVLAIQLLLKASGAEINFGETGVNKTKIAEFVNFLTSKDGKEKSMRDSWEYKKVKRFWDNEKKARISDLTYVRDQFINIELRNLSNEIDLLINLRESQDK